MRTTTQDATSRSKAPDNALMFKAASIRLHEPMHYERNISKIADQCGVSIGELQRETSVIMSHAQTAKPEGNGDLLGAFGIDPDDVPTIPDMSDVKVSSKSRKQLETISKLGALTDISEGNGLDLARTKQGEIVSNLDNAVRVMESHPELMGSVWYDEFLGAVMTTWQGKDGKARKWADRDTSMLTVWLQRDIGMSKISSALVHEAVMCAAFNQTRNEVREYMEKVTWDGVERLPSLMSVGFGAEDNEYTQAVGRCWMTSMVARVYHPGCQVDTVPVFEGKQGIRKSSALRAIGGKWFTESHESVMSKDFFMVMQGNLLIEIAEMHSFSKQDVTRIKGVITNRFDRYRKPYGRVTEDNPRMSVFACTTNETEWQKDDTGGRRFMPVLCSTIDVEWLEQNRDQLFAEATFRFKDGQPWWDIPTERQEEELRSRMATDAWEVRVKDYATGRDQTTVADIMEFGLGIETQHQDMQSQRRVGSIMRKLRWEKMNRRVDGVQMSVWVPERDYREGKKR